MIFMKVVGICLKFSKKKNNELIWIARTQDMGWTLNNVWAWTNSDLSFIAKI